MMPEAYDGAKCAHNEGFCGSFDAELEMPPVLPPLDSLRVLAACVRHRSFSRAAGELCLTPSAVSLRMRSLETTLGVKLFVRHGPRLSVTDHGLLLAGKVEDALATIQSAIDQCRRTKPALRVTCAPTFASRWLVPRLEAYYALPDAQPIALDATNALLAADQFDVAIRSGQGPWRGFSAIELLADQGTPMLSPALVADGVSLSPQRLLELPLIPDGRWAKWFELAGLPNAAPTFGSTRFATYELEAIAALKGVGVALLSPFLYADLISQGGLVAPFDTIVEGPTYYWALWRDETPTPHFVRWVQRELRTQPQSRNARSVKRVDFPRPAAALGMSGLAARVLVDPVRFPGLAAVGGERLFRLRGVGRDAPDGKAQQYDFALYGS